MSSAALVPVERARERQSTLCQEKQYSVASCMARECGETRAVTSVSDIGTYGYAMTSRLVLTTCDICDAPAPRRACDR